MAIRTIDITLDAAGIDRASEEAATFLAQTEIDNRGQLSARLAFEGSLLRLMDCLGEGTPAQLQVGKRFGRPSISVRVRGSRFDSRELGDETDWERSMMEVTGLRPRYAYFGGFNILTISCPRKLLGQMGANGLGLLFGVLVALAGNLLPEDARAALLESLVMPLFNTYAGVLAGVASMLVFFLVAWGICGIGDMVALGRSGKALVFRFLRTSAFATVLALVASFFAFPLAGTPTGGEGNLAARSFGIDYG